jgi:phosphoglycolate phosphatase-like HAD superfamily hydrolase
LIQAVIFDLDGTLIRLPINYERLFQEISKITKIANVRPLTRTISKLDEKTRKKVFEVWDKAELSALMGMTVNDGGLALYERFSEKPKALVTMQGKALVQNVLERLGLSFNSLVTREDCLDRVAQLRIAVEKLGKPLQNVMFIGNTDEDFLAAKKIGCKFLRMTE